MVFVMTFYNQTINYHNYQIKEIDQHNYYSNE